MEKRISKSFKDIFSSLYPNFNQADIKDSEEYFMFILKNYPDKSEINQLKLFLVLFSFSVRKVFLKNNMIALFLTKLQKSRFVLNRKLGVSVTALFGLSSARSLNGSSALYNYFDYPKYKNNKIHKKLNSNQKKTNCKRFIIFRKQQY